MATSRRDFFTFLSSNRGESVEMKVRLPYCDDVSLFQNHCTVCETKPCVNVCEQEIIKIDEQGIPYLVFKDKGCTFCDACFNTCPEEFLNQELLHIQGKIELNILKCLSWHKTMCFSCKDPCLENAINFLGLFRPEIDESKCTNCGFCIRVCPVDAIIIKGVR